MGGLTAMMNSLCTSDMDHTHLVFLLYLPTVIIDNVIKVHLRSLCCRKGEVFTQGDKYQPKVTAIKFLGVRYLKLPPPPPQTSQEDKRMRY